MLYPFRASIIYNTHIRGLDSELLSLSITGFVFRYYLSLSWKGNIRTVTIKTSIGDL